jgi:hypothetical protein
MDQPGKLKLCFGTNALAVEAGKQSCRGGTVKTLSVKKYPDLHSAVPFLEFLKKVKLLEMTFPCGSVKEPGHTLRMRRLARPLERRWFTGCTQLLIDGELLLRLLQLDSDVHAGLADLKVIAPCAEAMSDHLDANFAVGNSAGFGFTVLMGL